MAETRGAVTSARPISPLRTWAILQVGAWRTAFAHRGNTIGLVLGSAALQGTQLLFLGVLLNQFGELAGWGTAEIALLYGMRLAAHGVCTVGFGQHASIDFVIREGTYDRFLLRPASPLLQLLTARFNIGTLGDLLLGVGVLITATSVLDSGWSAAQVGFLVVAVLGGGLVEAGVQIGISAMSFQLRTTSSAKIAVDNVLTDFGAYPMTIFGRGGALALTFALPLAFMAYLPATVLLGRVEDTVVPAWVAYGSPLAGPLLLTAGIALFVRLSRRYDSPGN